jgi:hypothetical protein
MKLTKRKEAIQKNSDKYADARDKWINKNKYFYNDDNSNIRLLLSIKKRI